jgi:hypothetical protein
MTAQFKSGVTVGNGAAINIELGWVPDVVQVYNATDGDLITQGFLLGDAKRWIVPFSSGGTTEIVEGNTIVGATSGAYGVVEDILLYSGTWAAGDAAGFFVVSGVVGTFGSENVKVGTGTNDATVTANVIHNTAISTAVAGATGNAATAKYVGASGSASEGFTIGSTVAEEAKLLYWAAWRNG